MATSKKTDAPVEQAGATPVETKTVEQKTIETKPNVETVELNGSQSQKTGKHGVYSAGKLLAEFKDGIAHVEHAIAEELRKLGLVK